MQLIYAVGIEKKRPARPDNVPDELWKVMEATWAHDPESRPKFDEVRDDLEGIMGVLSARGLEGTEAVHVC